MELRELSIQTVAGYDQQKEFNTGTWCITEMYWSFIKNIENKSVKKFVLILGKNAPAENRGGVLACFQLFDFSAYFQLDALQRKKMLLDLLHNALLEISNDAEIPVSSLNEAYNKCIEKGLEYRWLFKDKYFLSQDRKYYGGIECLWEADRFEATFIILDKNKNELTRYKALEIEPYFGIFIYWAKAEWRNSSFVLQSKQGEQWSIDVQKLKEAE